MEPRAESAGLRRIVETRADRPSDRPTIVDQGIGGEMPSPAISLRKPS